MARYVDVIDLPLPPRAAFDLLADFARTEAWDPGVARAERLDEGPLGVGSRFRVEASFWGRRIPLVYEVVAYEPPRRLVLRARTETFESLDELHFTARDRGTRVSYEARLTPFGLASLFDPLLQLAFQPIGNAAARGLRAYARDVARERAPAGKARGRGGLRAAGAP